MVGLVSGYGSSDDESPQPVASSSKKTLPTLSSGPTDDAEIDGDDSDDDALEQSATTDAFGLAKKRSNGTARPVQTDTAVAAAPDVLKEDVNGISSAIITRPTDQVMNVNITYADMQRPVAGPEDPFNQRKNKGMNSLAGHVEEHAMDHYTFAMQQRTFDNLGYALNPSTSGEYKPIVGSLNNAHSNGYQMVDTIKPSKAVKKEAKRKRAGKGDASVTEGDDMYMGPWAAYEVEKQKLEAYEHAEEDAEEWRQEKKRREEAKEKAQDALKSSREEKTIFHGKELHDYAGRTYMHIPTDLDVKLNPSEGAPPPNCYVPERCIHTWTGHNKGVTKIELFPTSGHLLLSGSLDTKIKLWDVYHEGNCLRTYMGHGGAVKDVSFNNNGTQFLSCSYDKYVKIWDTETGQCVQAFSSGKVPNVAKFNPEEDKQHIFLAGMQDKKIIQYDTRMKEIVQTYDQHLGPVNTLTFVDENRRFLSTSDDKSIRGWDWDIPVVIKYIAEPYMHSMPAVTKHPNDKFVACQSLDNQILIYTADGTFRQVKKKRFAGHTIAGYACNIGFSPDGKYISSGTGAGDVVFWDWNTGKIVKRIRAHDQVVIDHAWLPNEPAEFAEDNLSLLFDEHRERMMPAVAMQ